MTTDSIFKIASMTKPITATAVMILAEEGKLSPVDPVERYLPEFRGQKMYLSREGDKVTLGPPSRVITIRDLLTHTSGMPGAARGRQRRLHEARPDAGRSGGALFASPVELRAGFEVAVFEHGHGDARPHRRSRLRHAVRAVPRQADLRAAGHDGDASFFPPANKMARVALSTRTSTASFSPAILVGGRRALPAPEGGLHSTSADLLRFYQMFLNGGELDGVRIVSPSTVETMTHNHTGDLTAGFAPGMGFGFGWTLVRNVDGTSRGNSIGTYGHGGAWRTYAFIDPVKNLIGILLFQKIGGGGDMAPEINAFIQMTNAALVP
ncbi:MAG: serine hydrolase domain-containing protein [Bryobacterales bacterium]